MSLIFQAIGFGVAVSFMSLGLLGVLLPIVPGMFLIWLTLFVYSVAEGFQAVDWLTFSVLTIIALITGTADLWMPYLGSKRSGASWQAMAMGIVGAIAGVVILGAVIPVLGSLIGGAVGYALGVLLGQYLVLRNWRLAVKAALGGLAGWGVSTLVQLGGGLTILLIFIWQVLKL